MDGIKDWVFPDTTVGAALRIRPRCLDVFHRLGVDPWERPQATLRDICPGGASGWQSFHEELFGMPVPGADSRWDAVPCSHLIDYLTEEHRLLVRSDLPAIRYALERPQGGPVDGTLLRRLNEGLGGFERRLNDHLREEEEILFPAILRNEYLARHPGTGEPPEAVSNRLRSATRLLAAENDIDFALDRWQESLAGADAAAGVGAEALAAGNLALLFKALEDRLRRHGALEREVLLPRAARLERELAATPSS